MIYCHCKFYLLMAETYCTRFMPSVKSAVFAVIIKHRYKLFKATSFRTTLIMYLSG